MNSVNTNVGAMLALQNLNKTNMELDKVQTRINTGLRVSSAKDDGAIFAIAQNMRADVASFNAVSQSLNRAISTTDIALAAGESISDILVEMKEKALAASDKSLDTQSRDALNEDFKALRDQIVTIVSTAEFNGSNLIDGSLTDGVQALANAAGTAYITVQSESMSLGGSIISISGTTTIGSQALASSAIALIQNSLDNVNEALARLGTNAKKLEVHETFVGKLSDELTAGIGNLVDADLAVESARLQSLQVKQQLGVQALSIANAAPQTVLSFFG